ncbi:lytic polysaccharide monooxygenase auxiliary activity family 9 protein [Streptomyces sp. KR80]|uniref:lytic polysaccharide monooxygenase auxiliary activity family 9 protein n=1 Tax=Streptomyces sp. KR80 TaxID=3457426 RepID=UPI003FD3E674
MTVHRTAVAAAFVGVAPLLLTAVAAGPAQAHGAPTDPISRVAACGPEGGRRTASAACAAAVAAGGGHAFDDWDNLRRPDVRGRDRRVIPDGQLCSAGIDAYKGLDLARADWPATRMKAGTDFTLTYRSTISHQGTFSLYLTKRRYDPAAPLSWDDLEPKPLVSVTDPALEDGSYQIRGRLPAGRTGRHVLYTIWRNSDTPDTYYSCSDLDLTSGDGGAARGGGTAVSGADDRGSPRGEATAGADRPTNNRPSPGASPNEPRTAAAGSHGDVVPVLAGAAALLALAAAGAFALLRRRRLP